MHEYFISENSTAKGDHNIGRQAASSTKLIPISL